MESCHINKGIGRSAEFKRHKAQYLLLFARGYTRHIRWQKTNNKIKGKFSGEPSRTKHKNKERNKNLKEIEALNNQLKNTLLRKVDEELSEMTTSPSKK